jgi:hypothetical protein
LDENAHNIALDAQLLDTNRRATTTATMHTHVRRNAYVYTTADLALTVLECDDTTTLQEVSLLDNHSGSSSGTAAADDNGINKVAAPNPIPIRAALNKLGLFDSARCRSGGGDGIVAAAQQPPVVVVVTRRVVLSSPTEMDGLSKKLEKLRHQRALYHQPIRRAHRMRLDDARVAYMYCDIFSIPEEKELCDTATTSITDRKDNDDDDGVEESFDCHVVCQIRREVHASVSAARKCRLPALVEIPDAQDADGDY